MISDWELWSIACTVERQHGEDAPRFIAERIGALALAGKMDGLEVWRQVAARVDQLRRGERAPQ